LFDQGGAILMTIHQDEVSLGAADETKRWSKPTIEDVSVSEQTEIASSPGTDSSGTTTTLS
jgi:hypothetical protein